METKIISYNLKDRGRRYRGKDRHFDIAAIVKAINSPACQERVRKRDMLGYYGHWPRQKFGIYPAEGGIEGGKPAVVEPALVTTLLRAYPDGTIEHKAEFLDTDSGKIASRLFMNRVGGFSSAIDAAAPAFYGFDYVLEPNYSTNRGWTLDGVNCDGMTLDDVEAAIKGEQLRGVMELVKRYEIALDVANESIEKLTAENEQLLSAAATGRDVAEALDSVSFGTVSAGRTAADRMRSDAAYFRSFNGVRLPEFEKPEEEKPTDVDLRAAHPVFDRLLGR